jgi:hypothetical protein
MLPWSLRRLSSPPASASTNQSLASSTTAPHTTDAPANPSSSGDPWLASVAAALERQSHMTARIRQRVNLKGEEFAGIGAFWQRGVGRQRSTRLELQTHAGAATASFVQVLDQNRRLWTDRKNELRRSVTRVDVNQLRAKLLNLPIGDSDGEFSGVESKMLLARGGLTQLIAELQRQFYFEAAHATGPDAAMRVTLVGRWKQSELDSRWPNLNSAAPTANWPEHLPFEVVLQVGRGDLFPYVIEYRRVLAGRKAGATGRCPTALLVRFEFYDVRFDADIEDRRFTYTPIDDWEEVTHEEFERLRPGGAAKPDLADFLKRREWRR